MDLIEVRRYLSTMRALGATADDTTPDDNPMNFPIADLEANILALRAGLIQWRSFDCSEVSEDDDEYLLINNNAGGFWDADEWGVAEDDYEISLPPNCFIVAQFSLGVTAAFGAEYERQRVKAVTQTDAILFEAATFITFNPEDPSDNLGMLHGFGVFWSSPTGIATKLRLKRDLNTFPDSTSENELATGIGKLHLFAIGVGALDD